MDWLAGMFEVVAVWMIGNKNRWGFVVGMACNVAWIVVAVCSDVYGLMIVSIPMLAVNFRNFRRWSRGD